MAGITVQRVPKDRPAPGTAALTRKRSSAESMVREWREVVPDTHVVTIERPLSHAFYTLATGIASPLLFTEGARQALAVLSHTAYRVPLADRLGWDYVHTSINSERWIRGSRTTVVELRVTHTQVTRRRMGSVYLTALVEGFQDGEPIGTGEFKYNTHPPAVYNRLRRGRQDALAAFAQALPPAPPVPAAQVDRLDPHDVVVSATKTPGGYQLRAVTDHEVLFDHPHDHIPGMVLLEAATQAVQAEGAPVRLLPVALESTFTRYTELDSPCLLSVIPVDPDGDARPRMRVEASQNGQQVFSTDVTCEVLPG
ncbi:ScbA/BarX family gamma-butyrolactone biosynthesis protein [Streptomyces sp. NPDC059740]|uniref:ScbA/BarX family gamma-butyrolactone biosynthesis protein n=1 Tax=Streptomyces sp. NPDC059740 TaxID=3346926 RepID=UPI00364E8712